MDNSYAKPMASPAAEEQGASVTITKNPDGTFMVSSGDDESAESPEMEAQEPEEPQGQPAKSIDEALDMARQMLQGGEMSVEEAFGKGFNGEN